MNKTTPLPAAYRLTEGGPERGTPESFLPFLFSGKHIVSLVGGGGKTTLMYHLAACCAARGLKTAVMTTTRIGPPDDPCLTMRACLDRWALGRFAVCGEMTEGGKFRRPDDAFLRALLQAADVVLIEADGAHRRPCKAPDEHEPVILPESDAVIAVMGLDALGMPIAECHRSEIVQRILGRSAQDALTGEDMARLLVSELGSRKHVGCRDYHIALNKCDDAQRLAAGMQVLSLLRSRGYSQAMLTAGMHRSEDFERPGK